MKKTIIIFITLFLIFENTFAQETKKNSEVSTERVAEYIYWYPAIKQAKMCNEWLKEHIQGEWQFTGWVLQMIVL